MKKKMTVVLTGAGGKTYIEARDQRAATLALVSHVDGRVTRDGSDGQVSGQAALADAIGLAVSLGLRSMSLDVDELPEIEFKDFRRP